MQALINIVTIRCGISKIIDDISNLFQSFTADAVKKQILVVIESFLGVVVNESLDKNIENFAGGGVLNSLQVIQRNVFMPVAYVILAYCVVIQLTAIAQRSEGLRGESAMLMPLKVIFKTMILKFVIDLSNGLMLGIYKVFEWAASGIGSNMVSGGRIENVVDFGIKLEASLNQCTPLQLFVISAVTNLFAYVSGAMTFCISLIVLGRIFEMYIYVAISPIPLAALGGEETKSVGVHFIKSFIAVCMQGVLIMIILFIYGEFLKNFVLQGDKVDFNLVLWQSMLAPAVLLFSLFKSGKWAKQICDVVM